MKKHKSNKILKSVVETKSSWYTEGNESKVSTEKNKGQPFKPNSYRVKKTQTKTQGPELEADTDFKGQCSDLEGYIFDHGPRALDKLSRTINYMKQYLGVTYIDICQTYIMTKTLATFPNPDMTTIIPDMGIEHPKTDA